MDSFCWGNFLLYLNNDKTALWQGNVLIYAYHATRALQTEARHKDKRQIPPNCQNSPSPHPAYTQAKILRLIGWGMAGIMVVSILLSASWAGIVSMAVSGLFRNDL